jgi:hypothetical protein
MDSSTHKSEVKGYISEGLRVPGLAEAEVQSSCTLTGYHYQVGRTWAVPIDDICDFFCLDP